MTPRSILAVTDFSVHAAHALDRAALLSAEHGARLRLAYLAYPGEAPPADAASRLGQHALQLARVHGIEVRAAGQRADAVVDLLAEARAADLVVWGTAPVRSLRSVVLGQPVQELLRTAQRPVLLARRSAKHPYRGVLVAIDFSTSSRSLVEMGLSLGRTASVALFHAVSTANEGKLRSANVSDRIIASWRDQCMRHAQDRMVSFTDACDARRNGVASTIVHGDPARQMLAQQQRIGSELLVVGKHPASAFAELLAGSVAGRILGRSTPCADVLVVPHDWQPASRRSAAIRLASEHATARRVKAGAPQAPCGPNPAALSAGARLRAAAGQGASTCHGLLRNS